MADLLKDVGASGDDLLTKKLDLVQSQLPQYADIFTETVSIITGHVLPFTPHWSFSIRMRSNLRTDPNSICAPLAQSSGLEYSNGLWLTPSLQGAKIMLAGTRLLA